MWHSSLRESLLALWPANCFHAGVQSNTLVCLGRDPTHLPANAFLFFNIQGELSVHKNTRLPGLLAEAIPHHRLDIYPLGSRSSRYKAELPSMRHRDEGGQHNPMPSYCWESLICMLVKYLRGGL